MIELPFCTNDDNFYLHNNNSFDKIIKLLLFERFSLLIDTKGFSSSSCFGLAIAAVPAAWHLESSLPQHNHALEYSFLDRLVSR